MKKVVVIQLPGSSTELIFDLFVSGKGITFDSGGLCLKDCRGMSEYRGDLAGAAVIVGVMKTIAMMALPIDVIGEIRGVSQFQSDFGVSGDSAGIAKISAYSSIISKA